jgi:hypothetical protein
MCKVQSLTPFCRLSAAFLPPVQRPREMRLLLTG